MTGFGRPLPVPKPDSQSEALGAGLNRLARSVPVTVCLLTVVAAALRFAELDDVHPNAFYDAAVRSMSLSWHNFFFGAFDPGGILSVDKSPVDLWLQVASTKVFGWSQSALKLPEALGGTLAVPLLYDAVRRAVGRPAGLGAALVLAVLPESVLTSRSDTMDSLMMLFVIGALWLTVLAVTTQRRLPMFLSGAAFGVGFNVKLFEALIAAPAVLLFYWLATSVSWRRRLVDLLLWASGLLAVGLSWAVAVSIAPGRHPYPVGSTDGTVWNVMFVFNGLARLSGNPVRRSRDPASALRLVQHSPAGFDRLIGSIVVAAVALGTAAVIVSLLRRRRQNRGSSSKVARGLAIALGVWLLYALALFSGMTTLRARYLEAVAPALATVIGYSAATLAGLGDSEQGDVSPSAAGVAIALACVCAYTVHFQPSSIAWGVGALAIGATAAAVLARRDAGARWWAKRLTAVLLVAAPLVYPIHESLSLVRARASDSIGLRTYSPQFERALATYLSPRTAGLRYELAVDEPLAVAPLIIDDQRPILPLTSFRGRRAVGLNELQAAVRAGAVRYGMVGNHTCSGPGDSHAACVPAAQWIRHHGIDVTANAGLNNGQRLYLLPPF